MRLGSNGYRQHPLEGVDVQPGSGVQFVDHCWLPDGRLAMAMTDKRVLLMEGVQVGTKVTCQCKRRSWAYCD